MRVKNLDFYQRFIHLPKINRLFLVIERRVNTVQKVETQANIILVSRVDIVGVIFFCLSKFGAQSKLETFKLEYNILYVILS